jgi:hypothetical protein
MTFRRQVQKHVIHTKSDIDVLSFFQHMFITSKLYYFHLSIIYSFPLISTMDMLIINGLEMILKTIGQSHYDIANKYKMYVNCRKKYNLFVRALETGISPKCHWSEDSIVRSCINSKNMVQI